MTVGGYRHFTVSIPRGLPLALEGSVVGLVAERKQPSALRCFHKGYIMLILNEVS
jgi:hypothetical protein